jgi:hypothetical protein
MREEVETARQRKHEEQLEEESEGIRLRAEMQKELDGVVATTRKIIREMKEEEAAETRKIQADAALMVKRIQMEKEAILKKIEAEVCVACMHVFIYVMYVSVYACMFAMSVCVCMNICVFILYVCMYLYM